MAELSRRNFLRITGAAAGGSMLSLGLLTPQAEAATTLAYPEILVAWTVEPNFIPWSSTNPYRNTSWGRASILNIQRALKAKGFDPGILDGIFGSKTTAATKAFQKSRGLKQDGLVGRATVPALGLRIVE